MSESDKNDQITREIERVLSGRPDSRVPVRRTEYKRVSFEPQHVFCTDVRIKRESWFWLKRVAWWLGLRGKPVHWDITYEFRYLP